MPRAVRRALFVVMLALTGCAGPSVLETWRDPRAGATHIQKLALMARLGETPVSRFTENEVQRQFPRRLEVLPAQQLELDDADIASPDTRARLNKAGCDAALVLRLVSHDKKEIHHPAYSYLQPDPLWVHLHQRPSRRDPRRPGYSRPGYRPYSGYPVFGTVVHVPARTSVEHRYTVEAVLYRLPEGRAVWSQTSEAVDPQSMTALAQDVVALTRKSLRRDKLIPAD